MRVMVLVKATADIEAGVMPGPELLEAMGRFNEELVAAGVLIAAEGLKPSSAGKRVMFDGTDHAVIDGPFAETHELVSGFWLWEVRDMDEALAWARRCPQEGTLEIRPVFEASDFGDAMSPELAALEQGQRERIGQP